VNIVLNTRILLEAGISTSLFRYRASLCFHIERSNVRCMLNRYMHIRGGARSVARLMAMLFAVQIVVGGFCLLTAQAHAMPQAMQDVHAHCTKSSQQHQPDHQLSDEHEQNHSDNCYHCDQPDELSSSSFTSAAPVLLVLSDVISLPAAPLFDQVATGLLTARIPTGPPRSSTLLYTTTQRILI